MADSFSGYGGGSGDSFEDALKRLVYSAGDFPSDWHEPIYRGDKSFSFYDNAPWLVRVGLGADRAVLAAKGGSARDAVIAARIRRSTAAIDDLSYILNVPAPTLKDAAVYTVKETASQVAEGMKYNAPYFIIGAIVIITLGLVITIKVAR